MRLPNELTPRMPHPSIVCSEPALSLPNGWGLSSRVSKAIGFPTPAPITTTARLLCPLSQHEPKACFTLCHAPIRGARGTDEFLLHRPEGPEQSVARARQCRVTILSSPIRRVIAIALFSLTFVEATIPSKDFSPGSRKPRDPGPCPAEGRRGRSATVLSFRNGAETKRMYTARCRNAQEAVPGGTLR